MVERKEGRERERERKGWFPRFTNVLCRRSLAADYPLSVDTGQKNGEPRDGGKKRKKKKRGAWQEAFEKLFSASTVSRGFPTPIPRHNWMG